MSAHAYDKFGCLGECLATLTDGPTDELMPADKKPFGTLGQIAPAQGCDEFQNIMWNIKPYYSIRHVFKSDSPLSAKGTVYSQALVPSINGLAWINVSATPAEAETIFLPRESWS